MSLGMLRQLAGWLTGLLLVLLVAPASAQGVSDLVGDWDGTLNLGASQLRLNLRVESRDGAVVATLFSLDQGNTAIPVTLERKGESVSLDIPAVQGSFRGTLAPDRTRIAGTWTQGAPFPLTFVRRAAGASAPQPMTIRRPQLPTPPFPYRSTEVNVPGAGGIALAGTLTLPQGAGPFPAVLLLAGSGPQDRDETVAGHKPFLLLADTLTRRGIAVLRLDKRGVGRSSGDYVAATLLDSAADAAAAVSWLRRQEAVDARRVGLLGHSEGGATAALVAADDQTIAFVVLLAGLGTRVEEMLETQDRLVRQAAGMDAADIEAAAAANRQIFAAMRAGGDKAMTKARIQAVLEARGVIPTMAAQMAEESSWPRSRFFLDYDPAPALRQVRSPVLALNGELDLQVEPKANLAAIRAALASNPNVTVREMPGLNHLFQTATTGAPSEYAQIEETMAPAVLTLIGDWIIQRTK